MTTSRSYEERHQTAEEVILRDAGRALDAERAARAMYRRLGALGSYAVDYVMGDLWSRPQLTPRDRSLVVIAVLASMGSVDELAAHVEIGLNHGLSREEIDEVVLQVAAYAGYPMAMAASRVVERTFCRLDDVERQPARQPAESKSDEQRPGRRHRRAAHAHRWAERRAIPTQALAGIVDQPRRRRPAGLRLGLRRGVVAARSSAGRDRSLVVVAILTYLSKDRELAFHIPAALNHGLSREEVTRGHGADVRVRRLPASRRGHAGGPGGVRQARRRPRRRLMWRRSAAPRPSARHAPD